MERLNKHSVRLTIALLMLTIIVSAFSGCKKTGGSDVLPTPTDDTQQTGFRAPDMSEIPMNPIYEYGRDTPPMPEQFGGAIWEFIRSYTIQELFDTALLVVDATVVEWLGEADYETIYPVTFFRMKINYTFKGTQSDEFVYMQDGGSWMLCEYRPLLKNGDRLLLFLNRDKAFDQFIEQFGVSYMTMNSNRQLFDIQAYNDELYVFDRYGVLDYEKNVNKGHLLVEGTPIYEAFYENRVIYRDRDYQRYIKYEDLLKSIK